ncbi:MAG TPA: DUF4364 family protein [Candidatus Limnocylindria bacterium]|nr:DUF4364 family protein [Candidatus Limnocylindria bacterium]
MAELPQYRLGDVERRLVTLYALRELGPCTNLQLIAFTARHGVMNYFDLQLALHDLALAGLILREGGPSGDTFAIAPQGEEAIRLFARRVGSSLLTRVEEAVPAFREEMRRERELFCAVSHEGRSEYHARMGIRENGMDLLRLDLSLPTAEMAERFCAAWAGSAREVYDLLIRRLSGGGEP